MTNISYIFAVYTDGKYSLTPVFADLLKNYIVHKIKSEIVKLNHIH